MNLSEYIDTRKKQIGDYLDDVFIEKERNTGEQYAHLYTSLREFSTKGKHLRGCLFLLSYEMAGGKDIDAVLPIAAAVEINGSALLIHDDIIDNDLLRRGGPSIFAQYIEEGKKMGVLNPRDYGVSAGILIGDIALTLGFELLGKVALGQKEKDEVFTQYVSDMQITEVGQMMDFDLSSTSKEPSREEILEIYRHKTAQYSLVNPFLMGAISAGAQDRYRNVLFEICQVLGVMFQMRDDVVGLMGDEKETGKEARSDVRENKKTLIRAYLFEVAKHDDRDMLLRIFGNSTISDDDFAVLLDFVKTSGVEKRVEDELQHMAEDVRGKLADLHISKEYQILMEQLVQYSLTRSK